MHAISTQLYRHFLIDGNLHRRDISVDSKYLIYFLVLLGFEEGKQCEFDLSCSLLINHKESVTSLVLDYLLMDIVDSNSEDKVCCFIFLLV
jgi:hypothetical protein